MRSAHLCALQSGLFGQRKQKRQKDKKQKEKGRRVLARGRMIGGADATLDSWSAPL